MTTQSFLSGISLLDRLNLISNQYADKIAITYLPEGDPVDAVTRTYEQLSQAATCVSNSIKSNTKIGDRVLLLLPPGPDYFAAVWGCLLAGVVVVPVQIPLQPAQCDFVNKVISDCDPSLLLTQEAILPLLKGSIELGQDRCQWLTLEHALTPKQFHTIPDPSSHQAALLQYTSGSTGTPKGVIATHENLDACIDLMLEVAAIDKSSTVVSWLPLFHNMGFLSFGLLPLSVGAHLVLIPTDKFMLNPARWFIAMTQYRGTHSGAPNIGYETCLNFLPDELLENLDLSAWTVAAIGSEPLKSNLIDQFAERFSVTGFRKETFLTTYGFSEATVFCSGADHDKIVPRIDVDKTSFEAGTIKPPQDKHAKTLVSVGTARPNVAVVDPDSRNICGDRVLGEIWICGPTVAKGYWNKPDVTAEIFGLHATDGSGPYVRSGDIGMIADGNLYVVGRRKELIIVGSKKLHPLDIEQVVNAANRAFVPYATIASAWETEKGEALAIVQELKPDTHSDAFSEIIEAIADRVYERFSVNVERIVLLKMGSLPRTHNGKLQRINCCARVDNESLSKNVVLDWRASDLSVTDNQCSPENSIDQTRDDNLTETEMKLVTLWQKMLNRPFISVHEDFVSLGGQSIIATRLVGMLRDTLAMDVTVRDLFKYASIRQLAHHIDGQDEAGPSSSEWLTVSLPFDKDGSLPLTSAQKRMWVLHQLDPQSSTYHMSVSYNISKGLCVTTLKKALTKLVERHQILRTRYTGIVAGEPRQHVQSTSTFQFEEYDLSRETVEAKDAALQKQMNASQTRPFDLEHDVMLRASLIRVDEDSYTLTLTLHHIAADGWSVEILIRELSNLYSSYRNDSEISLKLQKWQYAEWALRHEIASAQYQDSLFEYWQTQLQGLPAKHSLPLDRPYSNQYSSDRIKRYLSENQLQELTASGQKQGATLYMQLQLAMAILMARLTGDVDGTESDTKDIAIGAAYANRDYADCDAIVGFMVNSLVIRHQIVPDASLSGLIENCRSTILEAYDHADFPFEQLVEKLNPPRSDNYNPLFQVMINLQSKDSWNLELSGAVVNPTHTYNQEAKFDLALDCTTGDEGLELQWEFNSQILDSHTVERWSGYFNRILSALSKNPDQAWDQIDLLEESEKAYLLYDLNSTQRDIPDICVHELFEQRAQQSPCAIAVKSGSLQLTYSELNQQASQLASSLLERGVKPEDRIVMLIERSQWSIISMLGILKAGAAYVPIDPAYPKERIDFILRDSDPALVLIDSKEISSEYLDFSYLGTPYLDIQQAILVDPSKAPTHSNGNTFTKPENMAYMMYTSGSTGKPKGVIIEHRQITNLVFDNAQAPLDSTDCMAHCGNPAFDAATWEVWGALCRGACVAVISPETVLDPDALVQELLAKQVTSMMITVSLFNQYRHTLAPVLRRLRYCLIGGEAVDPAATMETFLNSPPKIFINDYGPTEATVFATCHKVAEGDSSTAPIPIGVPVDNTQIYILDKNQRPVPMGVVGEMYIGGAQVARGYWNRPDINKERFLENPFDTSIGHYPKRMYRTGDLARWNRTGEVEFIGRNDTQIKIRGHRVELGEIEVALSRQITIKDVVVRAIKNSNADTRLIAYIVASPDTPLDNEQIIDRVKLQLLSELPDYMIPTWWVPLPTMPLTPHGKLDYHSLPSVDFTQISRAISAPPITESEKRMARLWCDLLGMREINRYDNFFGLGGHSLLAVKLNASLRKQGYTIDIRGIFQSNDLADMASRVETLSEHNPVSVISANITGGITNLTVNELPWVELTQDELDNLIKTVDEAPNNIQAIYPLSPLQEGILFHHLIAQEEDPYLLRSCFEFDTQESLNDFLFALDLVIQRHDSLRTSIHWHNLQQPVQVVHRYIELAIADLNVSKENLQDPHATRQQILRHLNNAITTFEISKAPLIAIVVAESNSNYQLGIQAHHIIADHQALDQVFYEINLILSSQPEQLPETTPYSHYVLQQRNRVDSNTSEYFTQLLNGFEFPSFLFNESSDSINRQQIKTADLSIGLQSFSKLINVAQMYNISLSSILHLAWGLVVSACSGRSDVVFGTVLSGRALSEPEPSNVVGLFINTLPVRINKASARHVNLADCLAHLHQQLSDLVAHEHTPLAIVKRCSQVPANQPLFNTLINYRHRQSESASVVLQQLKAKGIRPISMEQNSHYPVSLSINETGQELVLNLQTSNLLEPGQILEYCRAALTNIADTLLENPEKPISEISILPHTESENLIQRLAVSCRIPLNEKPAHLRFQAIADSEPDAIAISYEADFISYRALNAKANKIAHELIKYGVRPNEPVAIYFERGISMVASLIAVLKAGAGYLPLDINLPKSRIMLMLDDAKPKYLLADANTYGMYLEHLSAIETQAINIDEIFNWDYGNPPITDIQSTENLAYMIYTSGSTGTPKGVEVEHKQLSNLLDSMNAQFEYHPRDRWTLFHSISFDFAVWEIWGALTTGAQLVVVPEKITRTSDDFIQLICDKEITVLNQTPGAFKALIAAQEGISKQNVLSGLRQVILSGEALDSASLSAWKRLNPFSETQLVNMYGITEITVVGTFQDVSIAEESEPAIGRPLPNTEIYILDEQQSLLPTGVIGEIYVGGGQVARGYWNRPELNQARFVEVTLDGLDADKPTRLYKSGDLGRWNQEGLLEYHGRNDAQVKIRGYRIELGEIENCIKQFSNVVDTKLLVRENGSSRNLIAYVVSSIDSEFSIEALHQYVSSMLPAYMLPSSYIMMESMPLTANGKIDTKALPMPDSGQLSNSQQAPIGPVEEKLGCIWKNLLKLAQPCRTRSFLEQGGDSLIAIQIRNAIKKDFNIELPLRTVFELSSIEKLGEVIQFLLYSANQEDHIEDVEEGDLV